MVVLVGISTALNRHYDHSNTYKNIKIFNCMPYSSEVQYTLCR